MSDRTRANGPGAASGRRARIADDLAKLGVSNEVRVELSRRLDALTTRLSPEAYDAALAGAVLAHALHRDDAERGTPRDLHEIQRMLSGFADELRKVDEALRILSTYVSRMRTRTGPDRSSTIH